MESKEPLQTLQVENKIGVSVANSQLERQPTKITGILNSRIEVKPSSSVPTYGFFKFDNQEVDIPVIFRIKEVKENCQFHHSCSEDCRYKKGD